MRWSQTLIPTLREAPSDAVIISHKLLVRAGFIRQLTSGAYDFLPLGLRSLRKVEAIIRQEMNRIGSVELLLPALQPLELWERSGRDKTYGDNLFKLSDRHGRKSVLGPTHEEVITELVAGTISSYKQLPLSLYQIQTKFRDEFRPRSGLLRVREFIMKDAYSFHADLASLDAHYAAMYGAYATIFERCGVPAVAVEAESGPIGGSGSHEFMVACDAGEDTILASDKGNYAANVEKCEIAPRPHTFDGPATGELDKVHTPNFSTIEEAGAFMKVKPRNMLKVVIFTAGEGKAIVAVVRGDHSVNPAKLRAAASQHFGLEGMTDEPAATGLPADLLAVTTLGYVSPAAPGKSANAVLLIDPDAAQAGFWTAGGDEKDYHYKHFNWRRDVGSALDDPRKTVVADIRNAVAGDPSPKNDGGILEAKKGIELGHVFKLGTKYSDALNATILDAAGQTKSIIMGCYGIGVGRVLIGAAERFNDDKGLIWPVGIAPYEVVLTPIKYEGEARTAVDTLYADLLNAGVDVLLDDRDARPGSKFADADLIGIPLRLTIGDRGLKEGKAELKLRTAADPEMVPLAGIVEVVKEKLAEMR